MEPIPSPSGGLIKNVSAGVLLLAVVAGGVLVLLFFVKELLRPGDLNALSLPLVAFVAAIAAVFNPCAIPALPGFFSIGSGTNESPGPWRRGGLSLMVSLGAMTLVIALGIIVAIVGTGIKDLIAPYFRWVQLAVGLFLIGIAGLHLVGQTSRLPLVGAIVDMGSRVWEKALGKPTPLGSYLFGAGFVAVGAG